MDCNSTTTLHVDFTNMHVGLVFDRFLGSLKTSVNFLLGSESGVLNMGKRGKVFKSE